MPAGSSTRRSRRSTASNVARLAVAWTWKTGEQPIAGDRRDARRATRTVPGDAARDRRHAVSQHAVQSRRRARRRDGTRALVVRPASAYDAGQPSNGTGFVHRGVATWTDGKERRILIASRWRLIALDAATGKPIPTFGTNGEVDLTANILWSVEQQALHEHVAARRLRRSRHRRQRRRRPARVQARSAGRHPGVRRAHRATRVALQSRFRSPASTATRRGKTARGRAWATRTSGRRSPSTLGAGSSICRSARRATTGTAASATATTCSPRRIVCLDAKTGRRVWHYQITHHGLWDYDLPSPPVLATIHKDGTRASTSSRW